MIHFEERLRFPRRLISGSESFAQHFQHNGLQLMVPPVGIKEIVCNHRIEAWAGEDQSDAMESQQRRFQIMDNLGSVRIMQEHRERPHERANVNRNEYGLPACGESQAEHWCVYAWCGQKALDTERSGVRQAADEALRRCFIFNHRRLLGLALGL